MKSKIPFLFFCLLILAGLLVLIRPSLLHRRTAHSLPNLTDAVLRITLTDTKANELLQSYLPSDFPFQNLRVRFSPDGLTISGAVNPDGILPSQVLQTYPELLAIRSLLPDSVDTAVQFSVHADHGTLHIQPKSFSLGGYAIPVGFLPNKLTASISNFLSAQLEKSGFSITDVLLDAGQITVAAR